MKKRQTQRRARGGGGEDEKKEEKKEEKLGVEAGDYNADIAEEAQHVGKAEAPEEREIL